MNTQSSSVIQAGVVGDHLMRTGETMLSYRYLNGPRLETDQVFTLGAQYTS